MKGFIIPPIVSPICPVSEKSQREELFVNSIGAILLNNKRIDIAEPNRIELTLKEKIIVKWKKRD